MTDLTMLLPEHSKNIPAKGQVRVLGIDLGTTNSTLAEIVWDAQQGGGPQAMPGDLR